MGLSEVFNDMFDYAVDYMSTEHPDFYQTCVDLRHTVQNSMSAANFDTDISFGLERNPLDMISDGWSATNFSFDTDIDFDLSGTLSDGWSNFEHSFLNSGRVHLINQEEPSKILQTDLRIGINDGLDKATNVLANDISPLFYNGTHALHDSATAIRRLDPSLNEVASLMDSMAKIPEFLADLAQKPLQIGLNAGDFSQGLPEGNPFAGVAKVAEDLGVNQFIEGANTFTNKFGR